MSAGFDYPVTVYVANKPVVVRAFRTAVPGLCVHPSLDGDGWTVTHVRSGCAVVVVDGPEEAQFTAERMSRETGIDFTLPAKDVVEARAKQVGSRVGAVAMYGRCTNAPALSQASERWAS